MLSFLYRKFDCCLHSCSTALFLRRCVVSDTASLDTSFFPALLPGLCGRFDRPRCVGLTFRRTTTNSTLSCSSSSCLSRGGHEAPQFPQELVEYCAPVPSHLPRRQSSLHIQLAHWKSSLRGPRLWSFFAKESRRGGSSLELIKAAKEGCRGECSGWSSGG